MTKTQHSLRLVTASAAGRAGAPLRPRERAEQLGVWQGQTVHALHWVGHYPEAFRPELADYAIRRFSAEGEVVFDPFCGRGTTSLQANLLGRMAWASDLNPLAVHMSRAKMIPVGFDEIVLSLNRVNFSRPAVLKDFEGVFSHFYHPDTFRELLNLREFISGCDERSDRVAQFLELLTISRLHGHTHGYLSGYSSPHEAFPPDKQRLLNLRRRVRPEYRAVAPRIIRRAAEILCDGFSPGFFDASMRSVVRMGDARSNSWVAPDSVDLVMTSPPVKVGENYAERFWLEFWFARLSPVRYARELEACRKSGSFQEFTAQVFRELLRVVKPGRNVLIETAPVEPGSLPYDPEERFIRAAESANYGEKKFVVEEVLINKDSQPTTPPGARAHAAPRRSRLIVLRAAARRVPVHRPIAR